MAGFGFFGISPRMKKVRVIVKTESGQYQIYVNRAGECTLYAVTDKLPEAKNLVQKAKRELGIARGSASSDGLLQADPKK